MPTQEMNSVPALLILEDGMVFHGRSFGKIGTASGELCFNTGMTGYQEIFTDPSYFGQIVVKKRLQSSNLFLTLFWINKILVY
jgi:carbamoyl-phosphate synthase small subunit